MPSPLDRATKRNAYRLDTAAATETSRSFNDEHHRQTEQHARALPFMFKIWDATLDKRSCPVCSDLSGDMVHYGFDFDGGNVPGNVHPRCRCRVASLFLPVGYTVEKESQ